MSDFGLFESDEAAQSKPQVQARLAARKMEAAIDVVRSRFGRFLMGATGIDEFGDRWHYSKHDIRAAVEPYVFPNTGTMRRLHNALKQDWKVAHPYKLAEDRDAPIQDLDETYRPSDANLIPEGDFEGYKNSVDQNAPAKVQRDFGRGGDTGSDKHARHLKKVRGSEDDENKKEAAMLVADIYTDFARANGLRVASLNTLDRYAATGIHDADYRLLQSMIIATAAEDCECDDDEDGESDESDSDGESEAPSASESDDSDSDDDSDEDYDFGGEDAAEGESEDSEDDDETDDSGASETESDDDYGFGDEDGDGDHDDEDHHDGGGGEQFTVPEHAPELPPEMMSEIPQDDASGSAPVPPEVIDSLLGLPEGTIEQLLLEEVEQSQGGDPGMSGPPMPPEGDPGMGGAPQGGGDDFFGGGGDEPEPPRLARRRQAKDYGRKCSECKSDNTDYSPSSNDYDCYDCGATFKPYSNSKKSPKKESNLLQARQFWATDGDEQPAESGGGEQQAAPAQDPAAAGGQPPMDPTAMGMQQPMMPPPGSQAVQPPTPPQPLENQPAEDALLDTANQAIMQMIDRETQEYQQIIDPLSQALQAIQFAQQVEQSEHPMDVTPPQGTVDVSPSAAPGGQAPQQPMQQMAMRRQAKVETALRNAAALIAHRYRLSATGHQMLVEATLGRRGYEHVVEALRLVPPDVRKAAAIHMSHLFAAGNQRFNKDVFLKTVMASNPRDRAGDAWRDGRDRGIAEHGRHDMEDVGYLDLHPSPGKPRTLRDRLSEGADLDWVDGTDRKASRGRLPFELPRRQAGETWAATPTMDAFEFPNAGETPRVDDNNDFNNLPVMKGADPHGKNAASQKAVDRFQRWQTRQQQMGLPTTQGESAVHNFLQTSRPYKKRVGPDAANMIHRELGLTPDSPKNPKAKPVKAVNPALGKGSGQTPKAPKAKAPAPKAAPKTASFFTRKVPGWRWDDHLNGYLSKEARAFTCSCGQKVAAPSYKTCGCGKIWNVTAIGDTHHLASDTADFYVAREIPVRPGVILAGKNMEAGIPSEDGEMASSSGSRRIRGVQSRTGAQRGSDGSASAFWETDPARSGTEDQHRGKSPRVSHRASGAGQDPDGARADGSGVSRAIGRSAGAAPQRRSARQPSGESGLRDSRGQHGGHGAPRHSVAAAQDALLQRSFAGGAESGAQSGAARVAAMPGLPASTQLGEESPRGGFPSRSGSVSPGNYGIVNAARKSHRELLAEIERLADWTKYDGPDPSRDPKVKPPSTTIKSQPGDWTNRDFTGPTKGQWREPDPTELPRKTRKKK